MIEEVAFATAQANTQSWCNFWLPSSDANKTIDKVDRYLIVACNFEIIDTNEAGTLHL